MRALKSLSDQIFDVLDNCDNVVDYLSSESFPTAFRHEDMSNLIEAKREEQRQMRQAIADNYDFRSFPRIVDDGARFFKFASEPRDILVELILWKCPFRVGMKPIKVKKKSMTVWMISCELFGDN